MFKKSTGSGTNENSDNLCSAKFNTKILNKLYFLIYLRGSSSYKPEEPLYHIILRGLFLSATALFINTLLFLYILYEEYRELYDYPVYRNIHHKQP